MATLDNSFVLEQLKQQFDAAIISSEEPYGMLTLTIEPSKINDILSFLNQNENIQARFLTDICGSHYPSNVGGELCVVYHVQSMTMNYRLRIKCFIPIANPEIPSVTGIYASANWMERETFDFYGVVFTGHPDLRRILNADEMDYFPLRKEYPLEDGTRTDKTDLYFGR